MTQSIFYVSGMVSGGFILSQTYTQLHIFIPMVLLIAVFSLSTFFNRRQTKRVQHKNKLLNQERCTLLEIRHKAKQGSQITAEMLTASLRATRQIQKEFD